MSNKTRNSFERYFNNGDATGGSHYDSSTNTIKEKVAATKHNSATLLFLPNTTTTTHFIKAKGSIQKRTPADDVLSKNISFLLENLLKRYENSHLPTHGQGECRKHKQF